MPLWIQHLLVIAAVLACVAFIARSAVRALHGRKSKLAGCGTCTGCATPDAPTPDARPAQRVTIIPTEMLIARKSAAGSPRD